MMTATIHSPGTCLYVGCTRWSGCCRIGVVQAWSFYCVVSSVYCCWTNWLRQKWGFLVLDMWWDFLELSSLVSLELLLPYSRNHRERYTVLLLLFSYLDRNSDAQGSSFGGKRDVSVKLCKKVVFAYKSRQVVQIGNDT